MTSNAMKATVYPDRTGRKYGSHGNIVWAQRNRGDAYYRVSEFAMRGGKFPPNHPVGGGFCDSGDGQCGSGPTIAAFRERGYWASCFPEGDGITWKRLLGQSDRQCMEDIRQCFPQLLSTWADGVTLEDAQSTRHTSEV